MIRHRHARALYLGVAAAALFASPAFAQDTPAAQPVVDDVQANADAPADIVVTARRRSETLLNVPIAVTAFTADKLSRWARST